MKATVKKLPQNDEAKAAEEAGKRLKMLKVLLWRHSRAEKAAAEAKTAESANRKYKAESITKAQEALLRTLVVRYLQRAYRNMFWRFLVPIFAAVKLV